MLLLDHLLRRVPTHANVRHLRQQLQLTVFLLKEVTIIIEVVHAHKSIVVDLKELADEFVAEEDLGGFLLEAVEHLVLKVLIVSHPVKTAAVSHQLAHNLVFLRVQLDEVLVQHLDCFLRGRCRIAVDI